MSKKLYKVTCRGMQGGMGRTTYGIAYVVAEDPTAAYKKLREALDNRDLGFDKARELEKVELLAEAVDYPDCGTVLYV